MTGKLLFVTAYAFSLASLAAVKSSDTCSLQQPDMIALGSISSLFCCGGDDLTLNFL